MSKKLKIAIVGAGNAACVTALLYQYYSRFYGNDLIDKITIYHDPTVPIERVGQGTNIKITNLIRQLVKVSLFTEENIIKATTKDGILYENWGKKNKNVFHDFPLESRAVHYVPNLFSKMVLESGFFEVVEKNITDVESEIDADYIFDCRGKNNRDPSLYEKLINPLNSVILSRKEGEDPKLNYTRCVATPDGWTFVIPNHDSVSYGYLYNNTITDFETAKNNFIDLFDVVPDGDFSFENYIAKSVWQGERTILNGNRLCFLEPLEATSTGFYYDVAMHVWEHICYGVDKETCNKKIRKNMKQIQNFVLWHYQSGSVYDTPFWKYARSLPFNPDDKFKSILSDSRKNDYLGINISNIKTGRQNVMDQILYSQWTAYSFKMWDEKVFSA